MPDLSKRTLLKSAAVAAATLPLVTGAEMSLSAGTARPTSWCWATAARERALPLPPKTRGLTS